MNDNKSVIKQAPVYLSVLLPLFVERLKTVMQQIVLLAAVIAMLGACASRSPAGALGAAPIDKTSVVAKEAEAEPAGTEQVQVADGQGVTGCKYLDTVQTSSSLYGVFAERGIKNARLSAMGRAKSLGGTHIVWEVLPQSYGSSQVAGRVYACKK